MNGAYIALPMSLFLTSLDADRDLFVSAAEVREGSAASFGSGDADGDGRFSPIEFNDWSLRQLGAAAPNRLQFDRNQDVYISQDEFNLAFGALHQRLDADKDGRLARAELLTQINGEGIDPEAMRAQMEAEMRKRMQGKLREVCQRGR